MHSGPLSPLPSPPDAARDIARLLFAREAGDNPSDTALVAASERLATRVPNGLSRWFGPYGAVALVSRALLRAQGTNSALVAVRIRSAPGPVLMGWPGNGTEHGAKATAAGTIALLEALADAIGRLIGEDLARTLLDQCAAEVPASSATQSADHATLLAGGGASSSNDARSDGKSGDDHHKGTSR